MGIATDLADFPFAQVIGLSSYPYLGGFAEPEDLPLDYYARLTGLPELVVEGGWPSDSIGALSSSPAKQGRYLRRQAELLDRANAVAVFQLTFTDLDPRVFPARLDPAALRNAGARGRESRAQARAGDVGQRVRAAAQRSVVSQRFLSSAVQLVTTVTRGERNPESGVIT